jgi:NAD dependent epimerase/dehydratase
MLVQKNFDVVAFDRYNPNNEWGWLEGSKYKHDMEVILGDIRDYDSVYKSISGCESVFHLAALIGIPYSYVSPLAYMRTNIDGTYNILEASKQNDLNQIIITSTSETYGTAQTIPIKEDHPLVGQSPYSATKIAADQLALSYYNSFNIPIKVVRPFNTYGPRQSARAIIPTVITQVLSGETEINLGNTTPTRDFTYVLDTCLGFLEIYRSKELFGEFTNIGTSTEVSIKDLCNLIKEIIGKEINIVQDKRRVRPANSEVERLVCDNTKLISSTKWKQQYDLKEGLSLTVEWFKENLDRYKSKNYNI